MVTKMRFQVCNEAGGHVASTKDALEAAMLVACMGKGSDVRTKDDIVWTEGDEEFSAAESYDRAAEIMEKRSGLRAMNRANRARRSLIR